ncbi:LLM class flavin-dependent oxidoreductase [Corynebacterium sp. H130]|uniref:LLM class flavin-dependent oxidoreductase n=1 Tax=Corynebacterium sp. H130 TaxID=3133444 RepID=UPI0030A7607D
MPLVNEPGRGPLFGVASFSVFGNSSPLCYSENAYENTIEEAICAEQSGIDFFGVSEGYSRSVLGLDPFDVVLDIGKRTTTLNMCTSIGKIATEDLEPRHEQLHTLIDATDGRVELVLDRDRFIIGNHTDVTETDPEFNSNLDEWCRITADCHIQPTWIEVSGRSDAILQAVRYRIPIMLQVNSGDPLEQKPFTDLYRMANTRFGQAHNPLGLLAPGIIAPTDEEARSRAFDPWSHNLGSTTSDREKYDRFLHEVEDGALFVGSPETVARKIATTVETLGLDRFYLRYTCGLHPHEDSLECIRLYGTEVIPRVRQLLGV